MMQGRPPTFPPLLGWVTFVVLVVVILVASIGYKHQTASDSHLLESLENVTKRLEELQQRLDSRMPTPSLADSEYADQGQPFPTMAGTPDGLSSSASIGSRPARTAEQQVAALEAEYQQDARSADAVAAAAELDAIARAPELVTSGISPGNIDSQCRARSCRIVASFQETGNAEDWPVMYATTAAPLLSRTRIVRLPQPDGSVEVRIYGERR